MSGPTEASLLRGSVIPEHEQLGHDPVHPLRENSPIKRGRFLEWAGALLESHERTPLHVGAEALACLPGGLARPGRVNGASCVRQKPVRNCLNPSGLRKPVSSPTVIEKAGLENLS